MMPRPASSAVPALDAGEQNRVLGLVPIALAQCFGRRRWIVLPTQQQVRDNVMKPARVSMDDSCHGPCLSLVKTMQPH